MEAARPATRDDLDALAVMVEAAVGEQAPLRGGAVFSAREARPVPAHESLAAALDDPDHLVVVGTIDDVPIGYAGVRLERLRTGAAIGVIEDIYVDPGARGVGVGEAIVDVVLTWCRDRGCVGVDGIVLPGNRDSKNFFETFGFTARAIVVHRSLVADGAAT